MKKTATILIMIFHFVWLTGDSQENIKKKQQYCSAKITLLDKSVEKYALGGFADDSVIVFPIQIINKDPQIQVERETRIAATSIKKIAISIEKVRNAPGIYSNDSTYKKGANDTIASAFKKNKTYEDAASTGALLSDFVDAGPVVGIVFLPLIPVFILLGQEKVYNINGKPEKLSRMEKELAGKKH